MKRLRATAPDGSLDLLALSGGGAGGAFGAGALAGLTRRGERPRFEIITGVSAGAFIATFAFAGPAWDGPLEEALTGTEMSRVLQRRTLDVFFRPSLYRGRPLARFIRHAVSEALLDAVAGEAAKGRLLLVATTDLDRQTMIIWNMSAIALDKSSAARELFRDIIVASASIPGIFPPVMIRIETDSGSFDEMHVDGGASVPFFVAPEVAHIVPGQIPGLSGANLYVLMNTQLGGVPDTVPERLGPVVARSFTAVLNYMSRKEVLLAAAFAHEHEMAFRVTSIPVDYPFAGSIDFQRENIRALYDYGERCAEAGLLWTTPEGELRHAQAAVGRLESEPGRTKKTPAREVPCPLDPVSSSQ
ncbi:MAG TPA: patatin-like phospholipase family protein [Thermoanaerobaculia bacterium]